MRIIRHYALHEVSEYINWIYFFHAWGFQPRYAEVANIHGCDACRAMWLASFPEEERAKAAEAMQLLKEAQRMLHVLDGSLRTHAVLRLEDAWSEGNDLVIALHPASGGDKEEYRFPLLRQQAKRPHEADTPYLCLSDYLRPHELFIQGNIASRIGLFAATVDEAFEGLYPDDDYRHMLAQTLADRLAEATTERLHLEVRTRLWGYAPDERLTIPDLLLERFQGIRPAVGYPSLPDQSVNFLLEELLDFGEIGIRLTEHGMMCPHASVSGLMFAHPAAQYFSIGKIGTDQLADYAKRRKKGEEEVSKYLSHNL
jgi:cobalamin-dependent methionine synthase I